MANPNDASTEKTDQSDGRQQPEPAEVDKTKGDPRSVGMTEPAEPTKHGVLCPNCQGPAIKEGNLITCEKCDVVYRLTKIDGARVKQTGKIQDLDSRLTVIEAEIFGGKDEPQEPQEDQGQTDDGDPEEEILPR